MRHLFSQIRISYLYPMNAYGRDFFRRTYFFNDLNVLFFNTMESRSKEDEELPTNSSKKSSEQLLDKEEEDMLDETYMGSLIDLIYQTWITNTFIKNLRMMIGYIQTFMVKQWKIDPNTIRMREAKTMKDALMSFLDALKER